jgi:hypothetical protein
MKILTEKDSRSRFLDFIGKRFLEKYEDEEEMLFYEGDLGLEREGEDGICIVRLREGFLSNLERPGGEILPAVEAWDGHTEWWEKGLLHREEGPAVITECGGREEYWEKGRFIRFENLPETPP